ncbi:hypothetical protein Psch_00829 [Pelotomaculum schinkii]|uniref:Uncharacterized protein n=1 Tax=Pelotomaculum schinkii TaxID=78350 RepID=A0A4Y7REZ5_9FIRM|nr:hypothetical protein Psch_00829 [Pelotomaculum schinkii]
MLGFTIGLGGLGVALIGLPVEYWGINTIIHLLVLFPLLAGLIGITIKDDYHKRARKPKRLLLQGD